LGGKRCICLAPLEGFPYERKEFGAPRVFLGRERTLFGGRDNPKKGGGRGGHKSRV